MSRTRGGRGPRVGKRSRKKQPAGRPFRWVFVIALLVAVAAGVWQVWPYWQLSSEFARMTFAQPSRLYALPLTVRVGERSSRARLEEHLVDLGYRPVVDAPTQGTFHSELTEASTEIFLRSRPSTQGWLAAERVRVVFSGLRIGSIEAAGQPVEEFQLEPRVLASIYGPDLIERRPVRLAALPRELVLAVLAAEDAGYFEHRGVSITGIARAAWVNLMRGGVAQGGSTLTQQLAKNLYLTHDRTMVRKVREGLLSLSLELRFDKSRLLEAYLNEIYWGRSGRVSLLGVGAVSRAMFAKDAAELTLNEAALLAGIIRSPSNLDPREYPEAALKRRNQVLERMVELEWITPEHAEGVLAADLPELRNGLTDRYRGYFVDAVRREVEQRYGKVDLSVAGWSLLSTLDLEDQLAAEAILPWGLELLEQTGERDQLQGVLMSADPETGEIRAWVGGRDYVESQFDRGSLARRQPGSAFKPIVLAAALENGSATPATMLDDSPLRMKDDDGVWEPQNYDRQFRGWMTTRDVIEQSINVPSIRLGQKTGWTKVVATARKMGVTSPLRPLPSMALGSFEIGPVELLTVYSTLATGGVRPELHLLRGALDSQGEPVRGEPAAAPKRVLRPEVAYQVNHVLQGVLDRGTARRTRVMGFRDPLAGKTGTTNGGRDSWFVGYAPNRATLVWVGYDDNLASGLSGSTAALPIWTRFADERRPPGGYRVFQPPPGMRFVPIDVVTGQMAVKGCSEIRTEAFFDDQLPLQACELHAAGLQEPEKRRDWWQPRKRNSD